MGMAEIKQLRERTGAGILDCKKALTESAQDIEKAIDWLKAKGITKAAKKASRAATEGAVTSYIHAGGKIGVLVEINCETDFVARTDDFQEMCKDIAMHIAAEGPEYVSRDQVPADDVERERAVQLARVIEEGKPEHIAPKIVDGRMTKWFQEVCLLDQTFVKSDDGKKVADILTDAVARIGENIQIRRFARFVLGEGLDRKDDDFQDEVAKMAGLA